MEQEFELIAKTFMGLEPVLAEELTQLGELFSQDRLEAHEGLGNEFKFLFHY